MRKQSTAFSEVLPHPENYGPYSAICDGTGFRVNVADITKDNWNSHFNGIYNILRDGIHTEYVQRYMITVDYGDVDCELSIIDYWFNLIMWSMLIKTNIPVRPKHIFFYENIRAASIKEYIDENFIDVNRSRYSNRFLNNVIADVLQCFHLVDTFSAYLCNTLNLEDTAMLMMKDEEFNKTLHSSFSSYSMDEAKLQSVEVGKKSVEIIKNAKDVLGHDHCLADALRTGEAINIKQYREVAVGIGPKPDGHGGLFPHIVDKSFLNGGVTDPIDYYIESSTARIAQIIKFNNVSTSGTFARILGLNNMDSFLNPDPNYDCHNSHLIPIIVRNDTFLKHLNLMYYREAPNGMEKKLNWKKDKHLVGKTIYLRTPITCASAAHGSGVCFKCYGDLAYTEADTEEGTSINIGRIAAETITSKLTQTQLSAKHIVEAIIDHIQWCVNFYSYFAIEANVIQLASDIDYKDYRMLINPDDIDSEFEDVADNDEDDEIAAGMNYDEFITEFDVLRVSTGEVIHISNDKGERLFITSELNGAIRKRAEPVDGSISIPFNDIKDIPLFVMVLQNNEISKVLKRMKSLYNKSDEVEGKTIEQLFQEILDTNIEGNLGVSAVHYAILLMNQVKSADNIFLSPDWYAKNPRYQILTLNKALNNNPSITISLSYQKIMKMFHAPLTYKTRGASFMDPFLSFCLQ